MKITDLAEKAIGRGPGQTDQLRKLSLSLLKAKEELVNPDKSDKRTVKRFPPSNSEK